MTPETSQRPAEQFGGVEVFPTVGPHGLDGAQCGLLGPAQSHQRLDHIGIRAPAATTAAADWAVPLTGVDGAGSLPPSSSSIRPATFGPMPGVRVMVLVSCSATARRSSSGSSTASTARAVRGPMPETDWTMRKVSASSACGNPKRVSESSLTTSSVWRVSSAPWRVAPSACGVVRTR